MDDFNFDALFDREVRMDRIMWIGAATQGFSDDNFFEDLMDRDSNNLHPSMQTLLLGKGSAWEEEDEWLDWLSGQGLTGFIVFASTPVPTKFFGDGYHTLGWGYTTSTMFYVDEIKDAIPLAVEWHAAVLASARAKASL